MLHTHICKICSKEFKNKRKSAQFCDTDCQHTWQRRISWEERIGEEEAKKIRKKRSKERQKSNPSKNKKTAKKISASLKKHLKNIDRSGGNNPFYGKKHSTEYKEQASKSRAGQRSYNQEQYEKLCEKTPRGANHPNWGGGPALGCYPSGWTKKLKNKIKERDDYTCLICNERGKKLCIHHIDYDKNNLKESNLATTCKSCHTKTNYNRQSWQAFFFERIGEIEKQREQP